MGFAHLTKSYFLFFNSAVQNQVAYIMDEHGCKDLEDINGIISFHTSCPARQLLSGGIPGLIAARDQNQAHCLQFVKCK